MAAPSFIDAGTGTTDPTGAWSYTCQASGGAGRVFILQVLQDGTTAGAVTFTSATNIENLAGTDNQWTQIPGPLTNGAWAVGSATAAHQYLWIGRALSTSTPTFTGGNTTSEDVYILSYQFSDVNTGTTLADVIENSTAGNATNGVNTGTTVSDTAVTTLGADRLALNFLGFNDDLTGFNGSFTGETGGDWTTVGSFGSSTGTDGAVNLNAAAIASPGTIDGGTLTITSMAWGVVGFALIGTTLPPVFGTENIYVLQAVNRSNVW